MANNRKTRVRPGANRVYTPPTGPSLSRFKDKLANKAKWVMGILLVTIAVTSVVLFAGGPFGGVSNPDASVAANDTVIVVDGKSVSRVQLSNAVAREKQFQEMFSRAPIGIADEPKMNADAAQRLIQEQVEQEAADKSNVHVSDAEYQKQVDDLVNQALQQQQSSFQSPKVFQQYLKSQGKSTADVKAEILDQLTTRAQSEGVDLHDTLMSELRVTDFKKMKEQQFTLPLMVRYSQIVISSTPSAKPGAKPPSAAATAKADAAAKAKAEQIVTQLKAGADFAKLAKADSSDTTTKSKGGDAGWAAATGTNAPPYLTGAAKAKVGDILGPTKSYDGYHVVKITGETTHLPQNVNATTDAALQQAADDEYQKFLDGLVKKAKVSYHDMVLAGAVAQSKNDQKRAQVYYKRGLANKKLPSDEKGWAAYALGQMFTLQNKAKEALPYFKMAASDQPTSAAVWMAAGDAENKVGDKKAALADYKKALQWASGDVSTLLGLQQQFSALGDKAAVKQTGAEIQKVIAAQRSAGGAPGGLGGALGGGMPVGSSGSPITITPGAGSSSPIKITPSVKLTPHASKATSIVSRNPGRVNPKLIPENSGMPGAQAGPHVVHPIGNVHLHPKP
ncbi:MAG TPA: peptidylprolyl isomerase [Armatimonadota bacterium]|nr:peptidylprolyl isomerase [Armatimonadota bacterium]